MIGELAASAITEAEVVKKTAEISKAVVDVSKRIDTVSKMAETKISGVDVAKRISPGEKISDLTNKAKELTSIQKADLLEKGMSQGIVGDCKYQDGVFKLKTVNEKLENRPQPDSGIRYVKKIVDVLGNKIEGVFPQFESKFTAQLPVEKLCASDTVQFKECTSQLQNAIKGDPALKNQFTSRQLEQISAGKTPGGYTWHHNEEVGKMELVDTVKHDAAKHTGGKAIWGGGNINR